MIWKAPNTVAMRIAALLAVTTVGLTGCSGSDDEPSAGFQTGFERIADTSSTGATTPTDAILPTTTVPAPTEADCALSVAEVTSITPAAITADPITSIEIRGVAGSVQSDGGQGNENWVSDPECVYSSAPDYGVLSVKQYAYGSQDAAEILLGDGTETRGTCEDGTELQRLYSAESPSGTSEWLNNLVKCFQGDVRAPGGGVYPRATSGPNQGATHWPEVGGGLYCFTPGNCYLVTDRTLFNFGWTEPSGVRVKAVVDHALDLETANLLAAQG